MNHQKLLLYTIAILMTLLLPIIVYCYSLEYVAFDNSFYKKEFLKHGVYSNLPGYNADHINDAVLAYLKSSKSGKLIENDSFNRREKSHLLDVKNLFQKIFGIYRLSIALFLISSFALMILSGFNFKLFLKRIFATLLIGSSLALIAAIFLFVVSTSGFNYAFLLFHENFFLAETYSFDPEFEKIVVLYPGSLFFDASIKIVSISILSSAMVFTASFVILFYFLGINFSRIFIAITDEENKK